jgi:hypothetical protein
MAIFDLKRSNFSSAVNFFQIWSSKPWIGIQPKMLDADPDSMNSDPKHWLRRTLSELRRTLSKPRRT